jgi:hypothetical protein
MPPLAILAEEHAHAPTPIDRRHHAARGHPLRVGRERETPTVGEKQLFGDLDDPPAEGPPRTGDNLLIVRRAPATDAPAASRDKQRDGHAALLSLRGMQRKRKEEEILGKRTPGVLAERLRCGAALSLFSIS